MNYISKTGIFQVPVPTMHLKELLTKRTYNDMMKNAKKLEEQ